MPDFDDGGHVGQGRVALAAGDGQRAHLALLVVVGGLRNRLGHELHLAAHQVGEGRRAAAVGDVHHEQAGGVLEHLGHQVADAAVAGRAVVDLARARLRVVR